MEKVFDLLSKHRHEEVDIREDPRVGIRINGLTETITFNCEETLRCLEQGSLNRRTGATAMNLQSSRSHAIFTLTINEVIDQSDLLINILIDILISFSDRQSEPGDDQIFQISFGGSSWFGKSE